MVCAIGKNHIPGDLNIPRALPAAIMLTAEAIPAFFRFNIWKKRSIIESSTIYIRTRKNPVMAAS